MGSFDVKEAKSQFLLLIDKVNATHLPGFAIWLDSKLAEYKVQGIIKADDETTSQQQYPEWISKSLRQNLSFIFQGDKSPAPLGQSSPGSERAKSVAKRKLFSQPEGSSSPKSQRLYGSQTDDRFTIAREVDSAEAKEVHDFVIKLEESSDEDDSDQKVDNKLTVVSRPGVAETPLPSVDKTFSLQSSELSVFSSDPSANVFNPNTQYTTENNQVITDQHSTVSGVTPTLQQSASAPGPALPHSLSTASNLVTPGSTLSSGSPTQGRSLHGTAASPNPGSASVNPRGSWHFGLTRGTNQGQTLLSSSRVLTSSRQCPVCRKSFTRSFSLKAHMRCHRGEKPFACRVCGKRFAQTGNCYRHERSVHTIPS